MPLPTPSVCSARRSELVALNVGDVERNKSGVFLHIRRSKTDQEGAGALIAVPDGKKLKPVEALDAWLTAAGIRDGALFRGIDRGGGLGDRLTGQSVALIVKRRAKAARVDRLCFPATRCARASSPARSRTAPTCSR